MAQQQCFFHYTGPNISGGEIQVLGLLFVMAGSYPWSCDSLLQHFHPAVDSNALELANVENSGASVRFTFEYYATLDAVERVFVEAILDPMYREIAGQIIHDWLCSLGSNEWAHLETSDSPIWRNGLGLDSSWPPSFTCSEDSSGLPTNDPPNGCPWPIVVIALMLLAAIGTRAGAGSVPSASVPTVPFSNLEQFLSTPITGIAMPSFAIATVALEPCDRGCREEPLLCLHKPVKAFALATGAKVYITETHPAYTTLSFDPRRYQEHLWFCSPAQAEANGYSRLP